MSEANKQKYWPAETRAYAERLQHGGNVDYTINIPGIQDVVRIGAYEDRELKRQRWLRYQATKNPAPAGAQAAGRILNYIDDAQDLLFTALALAWPLLRKLPLRMLPGLGWVLTVNDILNLMTCMLGAVARPGLTKPECFQIMSVLRGGRAYKAGRAARFLEKFPLWSFLFQAPQALFTVTRDILGLPGYGILPGPVMGLMSDLFWGFLRSSPGTAVRFNGPPPADFASKSFRYLLQPAYHHGAPAAFSLEDHLLLSAATSVASQVVALLPMTDDIPGRAADLLSLQVPVFTPWTESSLEISLDAGWAPELVARDPTLPELREPTYGDVLQQLTLDWFAVEESLASEHGQTTAGTVNSMLVYEAGGRILEWLNGGEPASEPIFSPMEQVFARQFEYEIFPPADIGQATLEQYLLAVKDSATARGSESVSITDFERTRDQFFG